MGLFSRTKNTDKPLLSQIISLVPSELFQSVVQKFAGDKGCSKYKTYDQFVAMSFGQLNKCYTLNDISTGLGISYKYIKDLSLLQSPARSTMSDGNKKRNWKIFEALYQRLIIYYEKILTNSSKKLVIQEVKDLSIKLIDSTTISVCLSMFDWAKFRTAKGGLKIHTCWNDTLMLPDIVNISEAKVHDRNGLGNLIFPKNTIIVEDRAYFDFTLMLSRIKAENTFVTRIKKNTLYQSLEELDLPPESNPTILKDEIIKLSSEKAIKTGISNHKLRLVHVYKENENKVIEIITNQLEWEAETIADLYKKRWDIEIFFKSIKQNLQIKTFLGTSQNAVKSQIYISLICYLLLQLINRTVAKKSVSFSNFVEKIRICLPYYLSLDYVCNHIGQGAKIIKTKDQIPLFQENIDLFSGLPG